MRTQNDHVMIGRVVTSEAIANTGHHTRRIAEAVSLVVLANPHQVIRVRWRSDIPVLRRVKAK